jgi:hypothetical protein
MATFGQLIDDVAATVRSFTREQPLLTWITGGISETAEEITVNDGTVLSRGRIEIGNELIILEDVVDNRGIIPPFGRGADSTKATAHAARSKVTVSPLVPRATIGATINQVIAGMNGRMFGLDRVESKAHVTRVSHELPADTQRVLAVTIPIDPTVLKDQWFARDYQFDNQAPVSTGRALYLYEVPPVGRTISIIVARDLVPLDEEGDEFTASGLPESSLDVVLFGAVSRLIATAGNYSIATRSVGAQTTLGIQTDDVQGATQMSRHYYGLYTQRLEEEVNKLLNTYTMKSHYSRRY